MLFLFHLVLFYLFYFCFIIVFYFRWVVFLFVRMQKSFHNPLPFYFIFFLWWAPGPVWGPFLVALDPILTIFLKPFVAGQWHGRPSSRPALDPQGLGHKRPANPIPNSWVFSCMAQHFGFSFPPHEDHYQQPKAFLCSWAPLTCMVIPMHNGLLCRLATELKISNTRSVPSALCPARLWTTPAS